MRRALFDTNVLLDLFVSERGRCDAAEALFGAVDEGAIEGYVLASSLKDFYYIARRSLTDEQRRQCVAVFMDALEVLPVDEQACRAALTCGEPDFEDGIVLAVAQDAGMDAIVTSDAAAFRSAGLLVATPQEALSRL